MEEAEGPSEILRLPKDRIGVAIGKKGSVKREIERRTGVKLLFDSEEGVVQIFRGEDPLSALKAREVLRAIGRGFSPEKAFSLLEEDHYLEVIELEDYGGSEKAMTRLRGRVIGEEGKARRTIEELSGALVSVYGKTVALIGTPEELRRARRAVEMLLGGAEHSTVYRFLERMRAEGERREAGKG
ncbi:MAG: KH domain-containing protein [Candidatus Hadarchaeales archaeon]